MLASRSLDPVDRLQRAISSISSNYYPSPTTTTITHALNRVAIMHSPNLLGTPSKQSSLSG